MQALIGRSLCPWLEGPLTQLEAAAAALRLGHGWLVSGPRGVGKANLVYFLAARLLGKQIGSGLSLAGPRAIVAAYDELAESGDLHPDLHRVRAEEDKHTIAVQQVREVTTELGLTSHFAGAKLVVIEAADTLTTEAANALLKSLEEPTPNTYLFLLAERPGRLPATIRSRCQQLALRGPAPGVAGEWLAADGLTPESLPEGMLQRSPIAAARLLLDPDELNKYIELQDTLRLLFEGKLDPHELAEAWGRGNTEVALSSLIDRLRAVIRSRLVPGLSTRVTEVSGRLTQNSSGRTSVDALFAGLQMAENLREQLGRGTNVELTLKSLLLGLELGDPRRVSS
jgi:DNA polymerase-3 subunit delta'